MFLSIGRVPIAKPCDHKCIRHHPDTITVKSVGYNYYGNPSRLRNQCLGPLLRPGHSILPSSIIFLNLLLLSGHTWHHVQTRSTVDMVSALASANLLPSNHMLCRFETPSKRHSIWKSLNRANSGNLSDSGHDMHDTQSAPVPPGD